MRSRISWLALLVLSLAWLLIASACDDETPETDADADGDAPDYPLLECGDHPENMSSCMLTQPLDGERDGFSCNGVCRPSCFPVHVCPEGWVCHVDGVMGLCFPEG